MKIQNIIKIEPERAFLIYPEFIERIEFSKK